MQHKKAARPLHVLFVLENYWPNIGGVETLFVKLAESLSRQGHRVTVITTRLSKSDPPKHIDGNIQILRYRFFNRYFFTLFAIFPVLRHAGNCDIVHTTSYNAALPAYLGARLRGKKAIVTFHEVWADLWFQLPYMVKVAKWLHFLFEQMLLRLNFDCFVGVSESTSENLRKAGVAEKRIKTIYNGIDYQEFADNLGDNFKLPPKLTTAFTYTYFGRLGISKGLDILLQAAQVFHQKHPGTTLKLIIPKTPVDFFDLLLNDIEKKNLARHIKLLHHLSFDQLKAELTASDCVAIPSMSEGFCFAAVESIALGVPVISSDKAALQEVVSGRFIKMKALTPAALVEALEQAKAGQWQQSPIKKFNLQDTVAAYMELYAGEFGN